MTKFDSFVKYINYVVIPINIFLAIKNHNFSAMLGWVTAFIWCVNHYVELYRREMAMAGWKDSNDLLEEIMTKIHENEK